MNIYLAGPMRGIPNFNAPAFDAAADLLRRAGHLVFNPAAYDREMFGKGIHDSATGAHSDIAQHGFNLRDALLVDLTWIADNADMVALLDGWEDSKGARCEKALAEALGIPALPIAEVLAPAGVTR